jgi:phosphonopyruvate decarboxylase
VIEPGAFYDALRQEELTFFTGVPDSLLKHLCAFITDHVPAEDHVINANEGSAVALAAGYHLATGRTPVVYLQNSGTGNVINPLLSLADPAVYDIPILFIIGWRGEPGVPDEPQHQTQGRVMPDLLAAIGLDYDVIDAQTDDYAEIVARACEQMRSSRRSHALLIRKDTFAAYEPRKRQAPEPTLTRPEAIELVLEWLNADGVVVSTTGLTSREVFAYRERRDQSHHRDFLTVGSMGHCSQIAMGVAQHQPGREVICLDGDGAVIMHMGSLAIIGTQQPENLRHIVINNGAHDSVGGQPTAARQIDLSAVALACGYVHAESVASRDEVIRALERIRERPGPSMLEIRVASTPHTEAGRPTTTPPENKIAFMRALARDAG